MDKKYCGNCKYFNKGSGLVNSKGTCTNHERRVNRNYRWIRERRSKACLKYEEKEC